jgi:hypothetical protein
MSLERIEDLLNIRLVLQEINPAETRIVINKTHIILKTTEEAIAGPQTSE